MKHIAKSKLVLTHSDKRIALRFQTLLHKATENVTTPEDEKELLMIMKRSTSTVSLTVEGDE